MGKRQGVGADIGTYIEHDESRTHGLPVSAERCRLESTEEINREVDSFVEIELPGNLLPSYLDMTAGEPADRSRCNPS